MRESRPMSSAPQRILCVGGLDPGGQAGLAADLTMCDRLGAVGLPVCAARTWQSDASFGGAALTSADELAAVFRLLPPPVAIKTGMLGSPEAGEALLTWLGGRTLPLVVDPIGWSSSGGWLWPGYPPERVRRWLLERLLPQATAVTPNWPELAWLCGVGDGRSQPFADLDAAASAAQGLPCRVVLKGGHAPAAWLGHDVLLSGGSFQPLPSHPLWQGTRRGTGCRFATALAVGLGGGASLFEAAAKAGAAVAAAVSELPP